MPERIEYLYLTTTGWKSGNPHQIEIWFVEHEGRYYLCSGGGTNAHWVQNIQRHPDVTVNVGRRNAPNIAATGRAIVDRAAEPELTNAVAALFDAKYNWSDGLLVELAPKTNTT